ncbi:hypothetical protein [Maritimibacter sp. DP1N21-5]|uniref:hypothetical protein n=1 Tax=Maritimibacter sp. DP1N21-5 TaxID=2836867 RepID=UPI001C45A26C|nr:hypothetical protein [Maritimibacter sp. DP1N21-5]MBV7409046.1 hypothetical protein [Maritimibacter sp. DP1N21-5]
MKPAALAFAIGLLATPLAADDVTDTLSAALQAYEDGDIDAAIEELDFAKSLLKAMQTVELGQFLPDPPDGWTREIDSDAGQGFAFIGGGAGTEAEYSNGTDRVTLMMVADNPMITAFGGMISNAAMLGMKLERIGGQRFIVDDGEYTALVDDRILVQARGAGPEAILPLLEAIDYDALERFGD